jgi:Sec-independent protein translocase protein TatA
MPISIKPADLFGPDDPPTLGRTIARSYQREKEKAREMHDRLAQERDGLIDETTKYTVRLTIDELKTRGVIAEKNKRKGRTS